MIAYQDSTTIKSAVPVLLQQPGQVRIEAEPTQLLAIPELVAPRTEPTEVRLPTRMRLPRVEPVEPVSVATLTATAPARAHNTLILSAYPNARRSTDWQAGVFILAMLLLVIVRIVFTRYIHRLFLASVSFTATAKMFNERSINLLHAAVQMDGLFYIVGGLFFYQLSETFGILPFAGFTGYLIYTCGIMAYFLLRRLLWFIQANVCSSLPDTREYLYNTDIYNRVLTVGLLPVCLVAAFSPTVNKEIVMLVGIAMLVCAKIITLSRGIKILLRKNFSLFYLILYLCTLEAVPLLYVYKLVTEFNLG
ncbi:MAG: DUF4271 domain-containing protein [Bacteroidales bacterium]|jgi:hypothetical protein|nr:DUF4271 domain-containing protein [Bacteroidales bacterium]